MSDTSETPDWLRNALLEHAAGSEEFSDDSPSDLLPGDIVVVEPYEGANACDYLLVVADTENGHFKGMLALAETEHAIDVDAILTPEITSLSYPIAVLTRFHGPMWSVQVRQRVGAIEIHVLEELEELSWNDEPADISLRRGLPLLPEGVDPRYPDRRALSLEFDRLTEHFRRRCHDLVPILDPFVGEISVLKELLHESGWENQIISTSIPSEFIDRFLDSCYQLSPDQQRAAQLLGEQALISNRSKQLPLESKLDISGHRDKASLVTEIGQTGEILPFMEVLTHSKCWNQSIPSPTSAIIESRKVHIGFTLLGDEALQEVA